MALKPDIPFGEEFLLSSGAYTRKRGSTSKQHKFQPTSRHENLKKGRGLIEEMDITGSIYLISAGTYGLETYPH